MATWASRPTTIPTPVIDIIAQDIKWTLLLLTVSVVLSFTLGTLIGIFMAWRRGSALDSSFSSLMTFFYSILYPWLALLAVYILGYTLGWFPFSDGYDLSLTPGWSFDFIMSAAYHAILPALTHHRLDDGGVDVDDAQFHDYDPL